MPLDASRPFWTLSNSMPCSWVMLLLYLVSESNFSQGRLVSLFSRSTLTLLTSLPCPLVLEEALRSEKIDRTLLIIEAGSLPPWKSGARVGRHAATMDIWGSMNDHMLSSATTPENEVNRSCVVRDIECTHSYTMCWDHSECFSTLQNSKDGRRKQWCNWCVVNRVLLVVYGCKTHNRPSRNIPETRSLRLGDMCRVLITNRGIQTIMRSMTVLIAAKESK